MIWIFTQKGELLNAAFVTMIERKGQNVVANVTGMANPNYQPTLYTAKSEEFAENLVRGIWAKVAYGQSVDMRKVDEP